MKEEKKPNSEIQILPTSSVEEGFVTLPYGKEEFRNFVRSLLGSPQSMGKLFRGSFDFDFNDVRNLYSLLLQRVSQQNDGVLANFSAKIIFSDNSSVEINSIEELMTYNEIRPIVSRAIHLTWDFVVRFQDKHSPEKQRIQVSIISSGADIPAIDENIPYLRSYSVKQSGLINFRIEHTARTWGADIEALLTNHIKSLMREPSGIKEFIRKKSSPLSLILFALLMGGTLIGGVFASQRFASAKLEEATKILQINAPSGDIATNNKLDYIALMAANGEWARFAYATMAFLIIMFIVSILLVGWFNDAADTAEPSFVLLSKESHKEKSKVLEKLQRKWISFVMVNVVSIIVGIASNFIFSWLINL